MDNEKIQAYKDRLQSEAQLKADKLEHKQELAQTINATKLGAAQVAKAIHSEAERTRNNVQKVKSVDIIASPEDIKKVVKELEKLGDKIQPVDFAPVVKGLNSLANKISELPKVFPDFPEIPEPPENTTITNLSEIKPWLDDVVKSITTLKLNPTINVSSPDVVVNTKDISGEISKIKDAINNIKIPDIPSFDTAQLQAIMTEINNSINRLEFPMPNFLLPFKDSGNKATQVQLDNGAIPINTVALVPMIDTTSTANTIYIGKALPGSSTANPVWQIKKLDTSSGIVGSWADGNSNFDNVWDDILTITYS